MATLGWQPIETAPKDFVVRLFYSERWGVFAAKWNVWEWVSVPGKVSMKPIYWMPLPDPPSAEESK